MNGASIYIELDKINELITRMEKLEEKLSTIVDNEKKIVHNLAEYWQGDSGNKSIDELNKHNANYEAYASQQREIRQQLNEGYVKNNTIRSEVEYSGFFNIKYKKINRLKVVFTIDGVQYPFIYLLD